MPVCSGPDLQLALHFAVYPGLDVGKFLGSALERGIRREERVLCVGENGIVGNLPLRLRLSSDRRDAAWAREHAIRRRHLYSDNLRQMPPAVLRLVWQE